MFQKFLYGLAWGTGIIIPSIIGIIVLFIVIEKGEKIFDNNYSFEEIKNYEIIKPSHRIIENTKYNDGLLITGEVKINANQISTKYDHLYLHAILRNNDGGYVDSCGGKALLTKHIKDDVNIFDLKCNRIKSLNEFSSYDFILEGRVNN